MRAHPPGVSSNFPRLESRSTAHTEAVRVQTRDCRDAMCAWCHVTAAMMLLQPRHYCSPETKPQDALHSRSAKVTLTGTLSLHTHTLVHHGDRESTARVPQKATRREEKGAHGERGTDTRAQEERGGDTRAQREREEETEQTADRHRRGRCPRRGRQSRRFAACPRLRVTPPAHEQTAHSHSCHSCPVAVTLHRTPLPYAPRRCPCRT